MAISYPLEVPSPDGVSFANVALTLDYAQSSTESPYDLVEQVYSYEAERWVINIQFPPLTPLQAKPIRAFILALHGRIGTFKANDPLNATPGGNPGPNAKVNGNGQIGYTLAVKDLIANINPVFMGGDAIEVNGSLYHVVKDVASDGSGNATLDIMPKIRGTITDGMAITVSNAKGTFRLDNAKQGWSSRAERSYDISIMGVEDK